ncbi:uncharacterized protein LOC133677396 isoform X3 [Populus nigra]|uniref:uncharacterized protein LOC133677396 isoform X3 n=1 Tax=Populus nigra TaxID=3691 RepID=UPI002B268C2A|nr:uncharacterized protein LOC133677396 isoform X3 [Populus nigra]
MSLLLSNPLTSLSLHFPHFHLQLWPSVQPQVQPVLGCSCFLNYLDEDWSFLCYNHRFNFMWQICILLWLLHGMQVVPAQTMLENADKDIDGPLVIFARPSFKLQTLLLSASWFPFN